MTKEEVIEVFNDLVKDMNCFSCRNFSNCTKRDKSLCVQALETLKKELLK